MAFINCLSFLRLLSKAAATARRTLALGRHDRLAVLGLLAGTDRMKLDGRFPIAAGSLSLGDFILVRGTCRDGRNQERTSMLGFVQQDEFNSARSRPIFLLGRRCVFVLPS